MKLWISALLSGCMLLGGIAMVMAQSNAGDEPTPQQKRPWMQRGQQQGNQQGQQQGRRGMRGGDRQGQGGQMRRMMPLAIATYIVIDVDKNGELSKEEIEGAAAALNKLDTNKDGKLTPEELMKAIPEGMRRMGPPPGGPDGQPRPRDGMRGQGRGPGRGQGPGPQGPPQGPPPQDQPTEDQ